MPAPTSADTRHLITSMVRKWLSVVNGGVCLDRFCRGLVTYGDGNHLKPELDLRREHLEEVADCFNFCAIGYVRGDYTLQDRDEMAYHASELMRLVSGDGPPKWADDDDSWGV